MPHRSQWLLLGWLTAVWVALWGDVSVANVAAGLVVAFLVKTVLPLPPLPETHVPAPRAVLRLARRFVRDLVVSAFVVAWQATRPGPAPGVAMVAVRMRSRSEIALTVVSAMQTLVPGSVVVEMDTASGLLYVHGLGVEDRDGVARLKADVLALEQRVLAALGMTVPDGTDDEGVVT
jgi:multicomponent Na+:H+ antiporter subunit E